MAEVVGCFSDGFGKNNLARLPLEIADTGGIEKSRRQQHTNQRKSGVPVLRDKRGVFPDIAKTAAYLHLIGNSAEKAQQSDDEHKNPGHGGAEPGAEFEREKCTEHMIQEG